MFRNSFTNRFSGRKNKINVDSYSELSECIRKYRKSREQLIISINETIRLFDEFSHQPIPEIIKSFDKNSLINLKKELGEISVQNNENHELIKENYSIENPVIVVLGQSKVGKSTFINILLKKDLVPQGFDKNTDRITRIFYSEHNFIEIIDIDGNLIEKKYFKFKKIPLKYVKLSVKDRNNPTEVNKIVKAGVKVKFLEFGIDVIDSPGMHDNDILAYFSKNLLKNVLPIVIYVIDGRSGVKQTDTADLLELISLFPNVEIIYFLTHLDTEDLDEESDTKDPIELSKKKMELSFRKLQFHNFIPTSYQTWSQCPYFHGASLKCLIENSEKKSNSEITYHLEKFSAFQTYLENIISVYFKNKILESCEILMNFQMDISTKIINQAENFKLKTKKNIEHIKLIKEMEKEMYSKIKFAITDSKGDLINRLISRLEIESREIIIPIIDTVYPRFIQIPESGIVNDPSIVDQCQKIIMKVLIQGLENVLKTFVEEELFQNYMNAIKSKTFQSIKEINFSLEFPKMEKSSYLISLERILNKNYKLDRLSTMSIEGSHSVVFEFMNVVLSSVKTFLSNGLIIKLKENEVDVKNPEWKLRQAQEYLQRCDHHLLAEGICKSLFEDFEIKHRNFKRNIESEARLIEKEILKSENNRTRIMEKTPNFYPLFLNIADIQGKYIFNKVDKKENIGKGAQSEVFRCILNENEIAMKEIKLSVYTLDDISKEIFYSHQFSHKNVLTMHGVLKPDDGKIIQLFYPLMKMNLRYYIKFNIIDMQSKLKIALEIAEGLQYLHDQEIIHQDLKLPNILVSENESIFLSDYGFCKSVAMTNYSDESVPIHIAPEFQNNEFTRKIDIYSFGILLWYLFEGSCREPRGAVALKPLFQVVWENSRFQSNFQMKPERVSKFPDEMWELMSNCWSDIPDDRPDVDTIITELQKYSQKIVINVKEDFESF